MNLLQKGLLLLVLLAVSCIVTARGNLPDFTSLVEKNHLAVVNISTLTHVVEKAHPRIPDLDDPALRDSPLGEFLRKFLEQSPDHGNGDGAIPREFDSESSGSGFIISEDGYVLTNNHVVEGADEVTVRLNDRRQFIAKVIGTDQRSDIALLKIDASDLPFVTTGTADELQVGEWVLAIGSPFGFDFSVTAGIVSAKQRALPNESYIPFIQTDVAINPGNSGGPLFNMQGDVVGINAQIYSRSGGFMGLSFAIPIDIAMNVAEQLKGGGRVSRGWLGVVIQEVTRDLAESFGMTKAYGALVSRILPNSPAAGSEIMVGDIIVAFNGKTVERSSSLPPIVGRTPLDKPASVDIIRDGKKQTVTVTLGELPSDEELMNAATGRTAEPPVIENKLNIEVGLPQEQTGQKRGVEVRKIEPGPAETSGMMVGDLIVAIDNKPVPTVAQFNAVVSDLVSGRSVPVLVEREQGPVFLAVKIP